MPAPASSAAMARPMRHAALEIAEDGLFAGVLGGLVVAVFFLVVDTINGRPLFTPSLLGSVLFQGARPESVTQVDIPMMFAYTGVHMLAFLAAGMAAAFLVAQVERHPNVAWVMLILFVCFEVGFFALAWALMPGTIGVLGAWLVGIANLLSAGAMAFYLLWYSHPGALRNLEHVWDDV